MVTFCSHPSPSIRYAFAQGPFISHMRCTDVLYLMRDDIDGHYHSSAKYDSSRGLQRQPSKNTNDLLPQPDSIAPLSRLNSIQSFVNNNLANQTNTTAYSNQLKAPPGWLFQ